MDIDSQLYERVQTLAEALMTAAERDQHEKYFDRYAELEALCAEVRDTEIMHPYLLETLGDFTLDDQDAIDVYEEALELSDTLGLPECRASIQLAIADRYLELDDRAAARSYADEAERSLAVSSNPGLAEELAEFRRSLGK